MKRYTLCQIATMLGLALAATQCPAQSTSQAYTFTTLVGGGGYSTNVAGTAARLWMPMTVAVDNAGNVYVADQANHCISKVTPAGVVTILAGRPGSFGSANGMGGTARFNGPSCAALDNAGNVYVADTGNSTIRKVTPAGVVTTLAGLAGSSGSANGPGSTARFNEPYGLAVDIVGNVYVADTFNHTIRKMTPAGVVTTLAGSAGHSGNTDGTNASARFNGPNGLVVDSATNIYVADTFNHTIRKMTPVEANWVVTTVAGEAGSSGSADGKNSDARFDEPNGVALDSAGNLYVADFVNNTIRKMTPDGTNWVVTALTGLAGNFGSVDGTNSDARFNVPAGVAVDSAGNVYVADSANNLIREMTPAGTNWVVTTLTGFGGSYGSADGTGIAARFYGPSGVAADSVDNVYVADTLNNTIRKVTADGVVTTLAGLAGYGGSADGTGKDARFGNPSGVAVDNAGYIYVADAINSAIRRVTPGGIVTTLAGLPGASGGDDGTNSQARFVYPQGVAVDNAGNLYVADTLGYTIRKVTPVGTNWVVTTLAGHFDQYTDNFGILNGVGTNAYFNLPASVAVDNKGNVYVADTLNHIIRKITPARVVTTLAGLAGVAGSADGTKTTARFNAPTGVAVDSAGNVFVADTYNNTIRKVTPAGVVTTVGGLAGNIGTANGTGSAARFSNPAGLALDSAGNLFVADFYFNTIRKGYPPPQLLNPRLDAGLYAFDLTGPPGNSVVVEASTDLANWLPISTNTFSGTITFSDSDSPLYLNRYYRVRMP